MQVVDRCRTPHRLRKGLPRRATDKSIGRGPSVAAHCSWAIPQLRAHPVSQAQPKGQGLPSACLHGHSKSTVQGPRLRQIEAILIRFRSDRIGLAQT